MSSTVVFVLEIVVKQCIDIFVVPIVRVDVFDFVLCLILLLKSREGGGSVMTTGTKLQMAMAERTGDESGRKIGHCKQKHCRN